MSTTRDTVIHVISVLLLLLWGGVMLFFYASERITHYLPPDGIFRPMVLWSSIGMIILGLFNLITMRSQEADCGHDHSGDGGCCGHDHDHDHHHDDHDHGHHHHDCCSHDHDHTHEHHDHKHEHSHGCCGHDHHHHEHGDHDHDHDEAHVHAHGILHESGALGRGFAIFMLAVPVTYAAIMTPDSFSANAVMNKGVYNQNYGSTTRADQFSLKNKVATSPADGPSDSTVAASDTPGMQVHDQPPAGSATIPTPTADKVPDTKGQDAKSMGHFTLADLEAQIPKSKDGNFLLEVPEIYYTAGDKEVQSVLTGQPVETIAQVLPEKGDFNPNGNRVRIFRMMVQCCAADARPYSIPVEFAGTPPSFKDMSWIKVTGKMSYEKQGDQVVPLIKAENMVEAAAPDDKMVY